MIRFRFHQLCIVKIPAILFFSYKLRFQFGVLKLFVGIVYYGNWDSGRDGVLNVILLLRLQSTCLVICRGECLLIVATTIKTRVIENSASIQLSYFSSCLSRVGRMK